MARSLDEDATAEAVRGESVLAVALLPVQMDFGQCLPVAHVTGHGGDDFVCVPEENPALLCPDTLSFPGPPCTPSHRACLQRSVESLHLHLTADRLCRGSCWNTKTCCSDQFGKRW